MNLLIWTFAPKHINSGPEVIEIATFLAVNIFNEGILPIFKFMSILRVTIASEVELYVIVRNDARIKLSELRLSDYAKQSRIDRREDKSVLHHLYEQVEGLLYESGLAD